MIASIVRRPLVVMRSLVRLTALGGIALAMACSAAESTLPSEDQGGTFQATVGGRDFRATRIEIRKNDDSSVAIVAYDHPFAGSGIIMGLGISRIDLPDPFPQASVSFGRVDGPTVLESWQPFDSNATYTVSVVVTQLDAGRVRGTFSGVLHQWYPEGQNRTMNVTNGTFDVRLR